MTDRYQHTGGICAAMQHVLSAAWQRRHTEADGLVDLNWASELATLRVVATAAHLFKQEAAEEWHLCTALVCGLIEG